MCRAVAKKIRRHPALFEEGRRTLAHWRRIKRAGPPPLREWENIFATHDMETVLCLLTQINEEGNRLRQTAPFCGLLTKEEQEHVWAKYDQG